MSEAYAARTLNEDATLPEDLTEAAQWIVWQYEPGNRRWKWDGQGKPDKVPVHPYKLHKLSWGDSATWMSFDDALAAYRANPAINGIGIVLTPELGLVGVDMDHAIDRSSFTVSEWAMKHLRDFGSYSEVTVGGDGYRVFLRGSLPVDAPKKVGDREIYDRGRFLTVTGNSLGDDPVAEDRGAVGRYLEAMQSARVSVAGPVASHGAARNNAELIAAIIRGDELHDSTRDSAFRLLHDGVKPGKVVEWLRGAMLNSAAMNSDAARWQERYDDIPRLVADAEGKLQRQKAIVEAANDEAPSPLRGVSLADVMTADESAWPHVMDFYLPRRVVTLLGGHGGVGKSMLSLIIAAHVAAGRPWGALGVEQCRVVFLSFEDEGEIVRRRLRRIIEAYELPLAGVIESLAVFDGSDAQTELVLESAGGGDLEFTPMMGLVSEAVRGAGLIVIDNASDTYGANENTRLLVRKFIRRLAEDAKANDAAVMLLAHIDKQAAKGGGKGNNYSGSTQWHNGSRSRLALVDSDEAGIELLHEKANYGPKHEPVSLQRGERGVLSPVPAAAAAAAKAMTKNLTTQADAENVLGVMTALIGSNVDIPTAETGQRTTYHVLSLAPEMPAHYRGAAGKERVKAAVMSLERSGRICRETYKRDSKTRERWTLAYLPMQEAA